MTNGADALSEPAEEFPAVFGCYRGISRTDIGWLTGQTEIQLRFHSNALHIWSNKLRDSKISLKVSPIGKSTRSPHPLEPLYL